MHASAARTEKGAMVFLGPSGTGKSTICQLLSPHAPTIALDAVYLVPRVGEGWAVARGDRRAHQGPLSREEASGLRTVPLRAIFRLFQGSAPRLKRMNEVKTCQYLTDALFEMAWQRDYDITAKKVAFADLAAICRSVPGYEFRFSLSPRTLEVLDEEMNLQEGNHGRKTDAGKDSLRQARGS